MNYIIRLSLVISFILTGCSSSIQVNTSTDITAQELQQHVKYFASDELKGRKSGEEGNEKAATYISSQFGQYGLLPTGDNKSYLQHFTFTASTKQGQNNQLRVSYGGKNISFQLNRQYRTLSSSIDTVLTCPVVFVGYGISDPDSSKYDDFSGIDVKNKIVIMLRYAPGGKDEPKFAEKQSIIAKTITAREKGVAGILFVTAPPGSDGSDLSSIRPPGMTNSGVAAAAMTWTALDSLFTIIGKDLKSIQHQIDSLKSPSSFELPQASVSFQTQIVRVTAKSANVVGYLPGTDPRLKDEVLVIGAHFDHLGMGGEGSGSLKPDTIAIHHGADDNASGSAGLLEAAQYLSAHRLSLKRSVLFIAFSGEELGLLGSDYYVKHPLFPLDKTIAMINMDMIGRLKDSTLVIEGMGTSPHWEELVKKENIDSLNLKLKPDGFGPSDHASFYSKDLPVMFFFTNLHSDYHRPSDTWEKINYVGEQKVVQLVTRIATDIANDENKPQFTKVVATNPMGTGGDRQGVRVSLGVVPDYAEEATGLKISGTRSGSAAEKAGLKGGDIIIKFGSKEVKNIYDFTYLLGLYRPGDEVVIVVKRGTEEVSVTAKLQGRQ
jgi:aminopeptidase YwaD